jgi:hypothetical protein
MSQGGKSLPSENDLVLGLIPAEDTGGGYLVFIRRTRAEDLARDPDAVGRASTWGEFRSLLPVTFANELEQSLQDAEVDAPDDAEALDTDRIPGHGDGDWPAWPAQEAIEWVPAEVSTRFGLEADSVLSGPFLQLDPAREAEIVSAFEATSSGALGMTSSFAGPTAGLIRWFC